MNFNSMSNGRKLLRVGKKRNGCLFEALFCKKKSIGEDESFDSDPQIHLKWWSVSKPYVPLVFPWPIKRL